MKIGWGVVVIVWQLMRRMTTRHVLSPMIDTPSREPAAMLFPLFGSLVALQLKDTGFICSAVKLRLLRDKEVAGAI